MGGINLYQYAPNPLTWIDPLGLCFSNVDWKKGKNIWHKGKLREHYNKHVVNQKEFGEITQDQYHEEMLKFLSESSPDFIEVRVGTNQLIKFDPNTNRVLIGHVNDRKILSFYIAQPELVTVDPLTDAINEAKRKLKLSDAEIPIFYKITSTDNGL